MAGKFDRKKNFQRGGYRGGGGSRPPWRPREHHESSEEFSSADSRPIVQDEQTLNVLRMFSTFQYELDARYDKMERIVKRSRDITIESKRIIFLLHRISRDREDIKESIFEDAIYRLRELCNTGFRGIALELEGEDPYQFLRPYSAGLQEFIEAALYYKFLKDECLLNYQEIQDQLIFEKFEPKKPVVRTEKPTEVEPTVEIAPTATSDDSGASDAAAAAIIETATSVVTPPVLITLLVPPTEYMLGIADFTGELMRKCINSLGSGEQRVPFECLPHLRLILEGFLRVCPVPGAREMTTKLQVLRQSVEKVENACYAIVVRRTEVPDYKLASLDVGRVSCEVGGSGEELCGGGGDGF